MLYSLDCTKWEMYGGGSDMRIISFTSNEYWEDYYLLNDAGDKQYLITIDVKEGTVFCTCPHFQYRCNTHEKRCKFGGLLLSDTENHCKHIKYVLKIREVLQDG